MPPRTANKTPIVVYLDDADHAELRRRADGEPLSAEARRILHAELASVRNGTLTEPHRLIPPAPPVRPT